MKVQCSCKRWHDITPTGLALIVDALVNGDLTTTKYNVLCLLTAFTRERVAKFQKRYPGSSLPFVNAAEVPGGFDDV